MKELMSRVIPGVLLACMWIILLFYGSFLLFWFIILICGWLCFTEYSRMLLLNLRGERNFFIHLVALLPIFFSYFGQLGIVMFGMFISMIFLVFCMSILWKDQEESMQLLLRATFGILFISFPLSHFVLLRSIENGHIFIFSVTFIVVASDIAAYYIGSRFGRVKLCPHISPNKTWEGAFAGVFFAVFAGVLCFYFFPFLSSSIINMVIAAVTVAIFGIFGDLSESMLKRGCGVKDSGNILIGHGGLLDRIDALFFAVPTYYYFSSLGFM